MGSTETLQRLHIDSAKTSERLYRNSTETLQKIPEILQRLQRFYRDTLENFIESCNGSTIKLLGSVAGIIVFLLDYTFPDFQVPQIGPSQA